jgi:hypothetical protein
MNTTVAKRVVDPATMRLETPACARKAKNWLLRQPVPAIDSEPAFFLPIQTYQSKIEIS